LFEPADQSAVGEDAPDRDHRADDQAENGVSGGGRLDRSSDQEEHEKGKEQNKTAYARGPQPTRKA
jgi:hypothetical protein